MHSAKFFLDGVVENRTAAMIAPYADTGGNAPLMFDPAQINEMFTAFDAARFQIHVHAIGDLATRAALDGMQAARQANADWPSLHQIAHIQFIDPADIPRFRALGVMANVQPLWARHEASVTDIAVPAVGAERAQFIYAFRSLLDAGAQMALSSDWGVSTLNPFEIIETAVTRQPPHKEGDCTAFLPGQRISRAEAVAGYTTAAAAAAWRYRIAGLGQIRRSDHARPRYLWLRCLRYRRYQGVADPAGRPRGLESLMPVQDMHLYEPSWLVRGAPGDLQKDPIPQTNGSLSPRI